MNAMRSCLFPAVEENRCTFMLRMSTTVMGSKLYGNRTLLKHTDVYLQFHQKSNITSDAMEDIWIRELSCFSQ